MRTHNVTLQHLGFGYTAPDATPVAATMITGDSKTILSGMGRAFIISLGGLHQTSGYINVFSPRMHDNNTGLKVYDIASEPKNLIPRGCMTEVFGNDTLSINIGGSATAGDIELGSMMVYYSSPGASTGRFITLEELINNQRHLLTLTFTLTAATTLSYGGAAAFSAAVEDKLKGNTDYAILGFASSVDQGAIVFKGPDTGNFWIGAPANGVNQLPNVNFFRDLAEDHKKPFIPVINSANKGATYVATVNNENAASPIVTVFLAELL